VINSDRGSDLFQNAKRKGTFLIADFKPKKTILLKDGRGKS
jgi:hypothetical protein